MKFRFVMLILLIVGMVILGGCQQAKMTQTENNSPDAPTLPGGTPGIVPDQGLDALNRLALGTLELEGTENAVTPEQAKTMLPLWQMIQGGALKSDAESEAVIKQIEAQMTEAQMTSMDGLTFEDMQAWMQEQGMEMAWPAGGQAPGGQAPGDLQNMTEEERAQMREKFQSMTEEERSTAMAEQGFQRPQGAQGDFQPPQGSSGQRPGGGMRGGNVLLEPLMTLLTERAASK